MIYFPADLIAIPQCPGYFWHSRKEKLFSIKVGGVLRDLKVRKLHPVAMQKMRRVPGNMQQGDPYYVVSVSGKDRYLPVESLKKLKPEQYVVPLTEKY